MDQVGLESRAAELGLTADEFRTLQPQLTDGVVAAILAALIRHEDALRELAPAGDGERRAQP